jgi:hypothetical protein
MFPTGFAQQQRVPYWFCPAAGTVRHAALAVSTAEQQQHMAARATSVLQPIPPFPLSSLRCNARVSSLGLLPCAAMPVLPPFLITLQCQSLAQLL